VRPRTGGTSESIPPLPPVGAGRACRSARAGPSPIFLDWLSELICQPVKEYTQFEAGLCLMAVLPPGDAIDLLKERCHTLEIEIEQARARADYCRKTKLPRLFFIESEYKTKLREAELIWVRSLVADIA
jgi:hypothetical protein